MIQHICKFCGRRFKSGVSLGGHVVYCKKNPQRELTIKKIKNSLKGRPLSKEHKLTIKLAMQKAVKEGRQKTPKPGGICKTFKIKNINGEIQHIQGSWEKRFVEFLNKKQIKWERNHIGITYIFDEDEKMYFPDFYLEDYDLYIEVKGYETEKDKAKFSQFPFKLIVIRQTEINNLEEWYNNSGL
jgi:hypothetical protein